MKIEQAIERAIEGCGFLGEEVVEAFSSNHEYCNQNLLVVGGGGRITCPAYRVSRVVQAMEERGDYVRSVQIPTTHSLATRVFTHTKNSMEG